MVQVVSFCAKAVQPRSGCRCASTAAGLSKPTFVRKRRAGL